MKSKQNSSRNPLSAGMVYSKHLINVGNEGSMRLDGGDDDGDSVMMV